MMRHVAANALTLLILGLVVLFGVVTWVQSQYHGEGAAHRAAPTSRWNGARVWRASRTGWRRPGAISSAGVFRIAARYSDLDAGVRFGEYSIPAGASMQEILELLNRGGNVLQAGGGARGADQLAGGRAPEGGRTGLSGEVAEVPAEGSLAPAGYDFQRGDDRTAILARMEERQREILAAAWAGRAADLPLQLARGAPDAGVDRGEGDRASPPSGRGWRRSSSTG